MQMLTRRLRENRVAVQWKRQMRHEKKGVKRRRLVSERWRRRFADEVCYLAIIETKLLIHKITDSEKDYVGASNSASRSLIIQHHAVFYIR